MASNVLLVETNRGNSAINLLISLSVSAVLVIFSMHHIAASNDFPSTPNQWVAAIFKNLPLLVFVLIPLFFLIRVALYHALVMSRGYVAMIDDVGIRVVRHGHVQLLRWNEMVELAVADRIISVGIDRSIRPGQRRIHREKVSLKYSAITTKEILRRISLERPDFFNTTVKR